MEGKAKKRLAWLPDGVKDAVRPAYVMLLRILRIPSHIRRVGLRRTLQEVNPARIVAEFLSDWKVHRHHAFVERHVMELLEDGRLSCLEKFGVVAEKGSLSAAERQTQENDVDLCLRVRDLGLLVVMTPFAELYHYESRSRGYENTPEKIKRLIAEGERIRARWKDVFQAGDPYYNSNFAMAEPFLENC